MGEAMEKTADQGAIKATANFINEIDKLVMKGEKFPSGVSLQQHFTERGCESFYSVREMSKDKERRDLPRYGGYE